MQSSAERGTKSTMGSLCLLHVLAQPNVLAYSLPLCMGPADMEQPKVARHLQACLPSSLLTNPLLHCSGEMRLSWSETRQEAKASLQQESQQ